MNATAAPTADDISEFTRTADGHPLIKYADMDVVFADALVMLSGVNFSSVEKVIAAMAMIGEFSETSLDELAYFGDVPTERVVLGPEGSIARAQATEAFVRDLIKHHDIPESVMETLRLRGRFQGDVTS